MSTSRSTSTRVTGVPMNPSVSMRRAASAASPGDVTRAMPPPLPRPPIWTCTLTATRPPSRSAAGSAGLLMAELASQPLHDLGGRGAGREYLLDALRLQFGNVLAGDDPAAEHQHVPGPLLAKELHD